MEGPQPSKYIDLTDNIQCPDEKKHQYI